MLGSVKLRRPYAFTLSVLALAGCDRCSKSGGSASDTSDASAATTDASSAVVNQTTLSNEAIQKALNPDHLPTYEGPTGSVEGIVSVVGDAAPVVAQDFSRCPAAQAIWGHAFREGPAVEGSKARALADAIVVVTGYKGVYVPEKHEAQSLTIDGCGFSARTVAMTFGQRLDISNHTKEFWAPYLTSDSSPATMVAVPGASEPVHLYPRAPGHVFLKERERPYAVVDVYTFLHPLHATTDLSGHYRIDGIPVGKLQVTVVHPQFSSAKTVDLDVKAGVVDSLNLELTFEEKAEAATDASAPTNPRLH